MLLPILVLIGCGKNTKTVNHQPKKVVLTESDSLRLVKEIENPKDQSHSGIMELVLGKPKHDVSSIGILVYDGVNDLDVMGPRYILGQSLTRPKLIAIDSGNIKTVMGVEIVPDATINDISNLDVLIIPGGSTGTIKASYNEKVLDWIRKIDEQSVFTGSVCTGGWILGATGLLEGKRASGNWYREEEFLKKYKAVPANERFTRDGKYWTSAGVTAGMDMSIAILAEIYGDKYAQGVMLDLEYDPAPPIEGGTPEKTVWTVRWLMKAMYDGAVNPIIDSLEQKK